MIGRITPHTRALVPSIAGRSRIDSCRSRSPIPIATATATAADRSA